MTIFAIIPQPGPNGERLDKAVNDAVGQANCLSIGNGAWLVSAAGTAQDLSNRIGISEGHAGSAMVFEIGSYYGRANPAYWSWIKSNWEGAAVG